MRAEARCATQRATVVPYAPSPLFVLRTPLDMALVAEPGRASSGLTGPAGRWPPSFCFVSETAKPMDRACLSWPCRRSAASAGEARGRVVAPLTTLLAHNGWKPRGVGPVRAFLHPPGRLSACSIGSSRRMSPRRLARAAWTRRDRVSPASLRTRRRCATVATFRPFRLADAVGRAALRSVAGAVPDGDAEGVGAAW